MLVLLAWAYLLDPWLFSAGAGDRWLERLILYLAVVYIWYFLIVKPMHQLVGVGAILGVELENVIPLLWTQDEVGQDSVFIQERLLAKSHLEEAGWVSFWYSWWCTRIIHETRNFKIWLLFWWHRLRYVLLFVQGIKIWLLEICHVNTIGHWIELLSLDIEFLQNILSRRYVGIKILIGQLSW